MHTCTHSDTERGRVRAVPCVYRHGTLHTHITACTKGFEQMTISNNFYISDCRKCGNIVWVGLCWAGFLTRLDVTPLTLTQEIMAKMMGRRTHQIHRTSESFETTPRRGAYLKAANAIVLGDHICDPSSFRFGEVAPEYFNRVKANQPSEGVPF